MTEPDTPIALRTGNPPAPDGLCLLEAFLNTWSEELGIEDLASAKATEAWLKGAGLWSGSKHLTKEQHQRILTFRDSLRTWILDAGASVPLDQATSKVTFHAQLQGGSDIQFRPTGDAYQFLVGTLIQLISSSQHNGTWTRFKCCELPSCGWAFYDSTRSRTRRWCSMKTCGSRHKAREYYKRKQLV
jgi:predicted RNA-binding Zn ribbon-like protein